MEPTKKKSSPVLKVILGILLCLLAYWGVKQYLAYKKYENIARFDYTPNKNIDLNYFDQTLLASYLDNCVKLSNDARNLWLNQDVDVKNVKEVSADAKPILDEYKTKLALTKSQENKLTESSDLKEQGLSNDEISEIITHGLTIGGFMNLQEAKRTQDFLKGKNVGKGSPASEIWELQKLINNKDYGIPVDGIFSRITDSCLTDFQQKSNLYVSHKCDDITLSKLVE